MDSKFKDFQDDLRAEMATLFGLENVGAFWGSQGARIVHIGQAPSISGIRNQKPFSDKSGERLRKSWYQVSDEIFYNPDVFYFTALGYYYPGRDPKGGDLRPSLEIARKWLTLELEFLKPELYIIIGRMAAEFLFPKTKFNELVFKDAVFRDRPAVVLPHPSPINIKWFKDNPEFENSRIIEIRKRIHKLVE